MKEKVIQLLTPELKEKTESFIQQMTFTKNFRSASAEEWYLFLPGFADPATGGAAGVAMIHYDLYGNKEVFIKTTIIWDDPRLHQPDLYPAVYMVSDEIVNRLVGYADTLLSVHAGENSYQAEYVN